MRPKTDDLDELMEMEPTHANAHPRLLATIMKTSSMCRLPSYSPADEEPESTPTSGGPSRYQFTILQFTNTANSPRRSPGATPTPTPSPSAIPLTPRQGGHRAASAVFACVGAGVSCPLPHNTPLPLCSCPAFVTPASFTDQYLRELKFQTCRTRKPGGLQTIP